MNAQVNTDAIAQTGHPEQTAAQKANWKDPKRYLWLLSPALPANLTLDPDTGTISLDGQDVARADRDAFVDGLLQAVGGPAEVPHAVHEDAGGAQAH